MINVVIIFKKRKTNITSTRSKEERIFSYQNKAFPCTGYALNTSSIQQNECMERDNASTMDLLHEENKSSQDSKKFL